MFRTFSFVFLIILVILSISFAVCNVGTGQYSIRVRVSLYPTGSLDGFKAILIDPDSNQFEDLIEKNGTAFFANVDNGTYTIQIKDGSDNLKAESTVNINNRSRTISIVVLSGSIYPKSFDDLLPTGESVEDGTTIDVFFINPLQRFRNGQVSASLRRIPVGTSIPKSQSVNYTKGTYQFVDSDFQSAVQQALALDVAGEDSYTYRIIVHEPGYIPYQLNYYCSDGTDYLGDLDGRQLGTDFHLDDIRRSWNNDNVTIQGTVKDTSGNPIESAIVRVYAGRYVMDETTTNSNGEYTLTNLPQGNITIRVMKSGYRTQRASFPTVADQTYTYDFVLTTQ